jgi:hypothetical protein
VRARGAGPGARAPAPGGAAAGPAGMRERPAYQLTRFVVLRLTGLVHIVAFLVVRLRLGDPAPRDRLSRRLPLPGRKPRPIPVAAAAGRPRRPLPAARLPDHARGRPHQDPRRRVPARPDLPRPQPRDPADPGPARPRAPLHARLVPQAGGPRQARDGAGGAPRPRGRGGAHQRRPRPEPDRVRPGHERGVRPPPPGRRVRGLRDRRARAGRDRLRGDGRRGDLAGDAAAPLQFRRKPGDPRGRPCVVSPYPHRIDRQTWFAAMSSPQRHAWTVHLAWKLLHDDSGAPGLLEGNPFPGAAPRHVRALLDRRAFAAPCDPSGAWWTRGASGEVAPAALRGRSAAAALPRGARVARRGPAGDRGRAGAREPASGSSCAVKAATLPFPGPRARGILGRRPAGGEAGRTCGFPVRPRASRGRA